MSNFEYPRLFRPEIISVLAEYQIAVISEADILRCGPDFICNLYARIFVRIGTFQEDQGQIEFGALEQLENPDQHSHSVQIINLYNKIRQLLAAVNCPREFTPKDLIKPEPERTEFFLSALLNFHLHRETKLDLFTPCGDDLESLERRQGDAQNRIQELNAEIAELEEAREREFPLVQEVDFKVKELHQTVSELNKHQMKLKTEIQQVKDKSKEMDQKISSAEFALVQSVQDNASLRSKIVQSPDKLQRALEEKKLTLAEAKNAERAAMQSFQDKTATFEAYTKACKKISKHCAQMQSLQEQVNSGKMVDKDVKVLKNKLSDEGVLIKSLDAKLVEMQSKADWLKESKKQLENERALTHEGVDKELNKVKLEVDAKRNSLQLWHRQVELFVAEADAMNVKRKNVNAETEAKMQELNRKYEDVFLEFENYSKSIDNLLVGSGADRSVVCGSS